MTILATEVSASAGAAASAVPAEQQSTPATPAAKPQVQASELPPEALSARLQQAKESERRSLLAELGVTDIDAVKNAIAAAKAADEAKKSDAQRIAEFQVRETQLNEALGVAVAQAVAAITPEQKAAVDAIAGNNQALWFKTYGALAHTWGKPAAQVPTAATATQTPAPAANPPVTPPASTAPITNNPAPSSSSPVDHQAVYEGLSKTNPFAAAAYLNRYPSAAKRQ